MKKFLQIVAVVLLVAFCVSCGGTNDVLTDEKPVLVIQETEKADTLEKLPEEKEVPVKQKENEKVIAEVPDVSNKQNTCTLEVRCDTILKNMDKLHPSKKDFVPENGIIFSKSDINFETGESAFQVLLRVMKENKIHMEFVNTPGLGSSYVEGIANIYEFDLGPESGWMYMVNGEFLGKGSSGYTLKHGDKISFLYTINRGRDIGGYVEE